MESCGYRAFLPRCLKRPALVRRSIGVPCLVARTICSVLLLDPTAWQSVGGGGKRIANSSMHPMLVNFNAIGPPAILPRFRWYIPGNSQRRFQTLDLLKASAFIMPFIWFIVPVELSLVFRFPLVPRHGGNGYLANGNHHETVSPSLDQPGFSVRRSHKVVEYAVSGRGLTLLPHLLTSRLH